MGGRDRCLSLDQRSEPTQTSLPLALALTASDGGGSDGLGVGEYHSIFSPSINHSSEYFGFKCFLIFVIFWKRHLWIISNEFCFVYLAIIMSHY